MCWMMSVQKVFSRVLWKIEAFIEEDTRNIVHRTMTLGPLQSRHLGTSHSSPNRHQLPIIFSWISSMVWNLFPFKGDFSFGKARSHRGPNLGCKGVESPGWLCVLPKKLRMRSDAWAGMLLWWSCQSPVVHSCGLLNHPSSFCKGMFKFNAKLDADSLLYSLSHFECDSHTVHMLTQQHLPPHWLVQWSRHCSRMRSPAPSSWLPGYMNPVPTNLVTLTVAGLFLDRPHIPTWHERSSERNICPLYL